MEKTITNIKIRVVDFKGKRYVDIRRYMPIYNSKQLYPTKKGVRFSFDKLSEVITALEEVERDVSTKDNTQTEVPEATGQSV